MSDTPQGDGWWQTSDGKWHPPDYDPTVEPTAGQPPADQPPGDAAATPPPWSPSGSAETAQNAPEGDWATQWSPPEDAGTSGPAQAPPPPPGGDDSPLFGDTGGALGGDPAPPATPPAEPAPVDHPPLDPAPVEPGPGMNRPGEFGLPSDTPMPSQPKVVKQAPAAATGGGAGPVGTSGDSDGSGAMSPLIKWSGIVVAVLVVLAAGWYFLLRDSGDDTAEPTDDEAAETADTTEVAGETTTVESTEPLPPKPTIAPGERLPVLDFDGSGSTVLAIDPPGPRVATISYTGEGPFSVTGLDANDGEVATFVETEGAYEGSVAVDFSDDQDSRSLSVEATGPWTIRMIPVEDLDAVPAGFTGTGDDVVLYSGEVGPVTFTHSGSGEFVVNTFEIRTREISTIVEETGAYDGTVELRGPAFVWIEADGAWSATPG